MAKQNNNTAAADQKPVTITLNPIQTAALGLWMDETLKATGMRHVDIISDIKRQIGSQQKTPPIKSLEKV